METFETLARMTSRSHEVPQWKPFLEMETFPIWSESFHFVHEVPGFRFTGGVGSRGLEICLGGGGQEQAAPQLAGWQLLIL